MKKIFLILPLFLIINSNCVPEIIDDLILDPLKHLRRHNLDMAVYRGDYYRAKVAMSLGANANSLFDWAFTQNDIAIDHFRGTLLELACRQGNKHIAHLLIKNGAPVNKHPYWTRKTALMHAAKYGHLEIIKLLLENGADLNEINSEGHTALDIAREKYDRVCNQSESELEKKKYADIVNYLTNIPKIKHLLLINKNYNKLKTLINNVWNKDICSDSSKHILSYLDPNDIKDFFERPEQE